MADYTVKVEGKEILVSIDEDEVVHIHETDSPVKVRSVGKHQFSVVVGHITYYVAAARQDGQFHVMLDGNYLNVSVESEREKLLRAYARKGGGTRIRTEIHAPMPALVVKVEVSVGESVTPGQGLVVLEAMKMENEIKAHQAGTVKHVHARAGNTVEKGELLILLE